MRTKDQRKIDLSGWKDLDSEFYTNYAGTRENGMSRFVKLTKCKSDLQRRVLENCKASLLDLSIKIYKKHEKTE